MLHVTLMMNTGTYVSSRSQNKVAGGTVLSPIRGGRAGFKHLYTV